MWKLFGPPFSPWPSNKLICCLVAKLEKAMATHSSTLAWRIPWTEEPGGLQSMGSQSWTRLSDFTFTFPFNALEKVLFIYFYFIFKLYNIVLVLPNIEMNPPQVYLCSPSWTLLPPPSPYHPSGSSQCTSPKHPVSCIELGLVTRFIHALEKEMATHSSLLAWRIPGTGEPGGLPTMGSHRVGHDWSDLAAAVSKWCLTLCDPINCSTPVSFVLHYLLEFA